MTDHFPMAPAHLETEKRENTLLLELEPHIDEFNAWIDLIDRYPSSPYASFEIETLIEQGFERKTAERMLKYGSAAWDDMPAIIREQRTRDPYNYEISLAKTCADSDAQKLYNVIPKDSAYTVPQPFMARNTEYIKALGKLYELNHPKYDVSTREKAITWLEAADDANLAFGREATQATYYALGILELAKQLDDPEIRERALKSDFIHPLVQRSGLYPAVTAEYLFKKLTTLDIVNARTSMISGIITVPTGQSEPKDTSWMAIADELGIPNIEAVIRLKDALLESLNNIIPHQNAVTNKIPGVFTQLFAHAAHQIELVDARIVEIRREATNLDEDTALLIESETAKIQLDMRSRLDSYFNATSRAFDYDQGYKSPDEEPLIPKIVGPPLEQPLADARLKRIEDQKIIQQELTQLEVLRLEELRKAQLQEHVANWMVGNAALDTTPSEAQIVGHFSGREVQNPLPRSTGRKIARVILKLCSRHDAGAHGDQIVNGLIFATAQERSLLAEGEEPVLRDVVQWMFKNPRKLKESSIPEFKAVYSIISDYFHPERKKYTPELLEKLAGIRERVTELDIKAFPPGPAMRISIDDDILDLLTRPDAIKPDEIDEDRIYQLADLHDRMADRIGQDHVKMFRLLPGSLKVKFPYWAVEITQGDLKVVVAENPKVRNAVYVITEQDPEFITWQEIIQLPKRMVRSLFNGRKISHPKTNPLKDMYKTVEGEALTRLGL